MNDLAVIDMDGPLVNFVAGAHELLRSRKFVPNGPMSEEPCLYKDWFPRHGITDSDFFKHHADNEYFWSSLPRSERLKEVLAWASKFERVIICTQLPPHTPEEAIIGKRRWISAHLPKTVHIDGVMFVEARKCSLALPGATLLDDKPDHVHAFIRAGGQGLLYPLFYNALEREGLTLF